MTVTVTAARRLLLADGMTLRPFTVAVSISFVAMAGLATPPRAQACSGGRASYIMSRQVLPADGSTDVPTNARIYVSYMGYPPSAKDHPALQAADGAEVEADVTQPLDNLAGNIYNQTVLLVPKAPLQPNTKYKVLSDFPRIPCLQERTMFGDLTPLCTPGLDGGVPVGIDGGASAGLAIATFTTGAGPDQVAPQFSGNLSYGVLSNLTCSASPCCGPYDGYDIRLKFARATDATDPVLYELSYEGKSILMPIHDVLTNDTGAGIANLAGFVLCSGAVHAPPVMISNAQFTGGSGVYSLVALDLAGNRSEPLQTKVVVDCAGRKPDGGDARVPLGVGGSTGLSGTGGAGTGGTTGAASSERPASSDRGGSCQIAGGQRNAMTFALLALGMLAAYRRSRRS